MDSCLKRRPIYEIDILLQAAVVFTVDAVTRDSHKVPAGGHDVDQQRHVSSERQ